MENDRAPESRKRLFLILALDVVTLHFPSLRRLGAA